MTAKANSTPENQGAKSKSDRESVRVRKMPELSIPDIGVEEHDNELRFRIVTISGVINVVGRHEAWHCTGCAEALALGGLIDRAWLPGLEGNNKISQTVCFGDNGPQVYRGNPMGRRIADNIRIKRLAADRFEVQIPATADQTAVLKDLSDKYYERCRKERNRKEGEAIIAKYEMERRNATPDKVMAGVRSGFEFFCASIHLHTKESGFQFDAVSARAIEGHLAALRATLASAALSRTPSEFPGNVIPFRQMDS